MSQLPIAGFSLMALGVFILVAQIVRLYRSKPEEPKVSTGMIVSTLVLFGVGTVLVILSAWLGGHPIISAVHNASETTS